MGIMRCMIVPAAASSAACVSGDARCWRCETVSPFQAAPLQLVANPRRWGDWQFGGQCLASFCLRRILHTDTGVAWNVRRVLAKTPSRRHFESKRTSKTGSTSKIGSRNGFVRFGNFCMFRSLSPNGVLNSGHKLTVTYYGEITIEPILNPEFDVDHDFEVKNGCFQSLFPRFRVISAYSTGRASHSDHFSGQVSMATILQDFYLFRRGFHLRVRDHLPDEG